MKKFKKVLVIFLVIIVLTPMVASSRENEREFATPEKSVEIFLDVVLKDKKDEMSKIGMKEMDYEKIKKELDSELTEGANSTFSINKDVITQEIVSILNKGIISGISKVDYQTTKISQTKNKAQVEIKIRGLDLKKIIHRTEEEFRSSKIGENLSISQTEMTQEIFKIWAKYLGEGIIVDNPMAINITVVKKGEYWFISEEEMKKLGETLFD